MTQKVHGTRRPGEVLSGDINFLIAYTIVDITDAGDSNPKGNSKTYRQSQNTNTLIQVLSMRTQLVLSSVYKLETQDLSDYDFGTDYTGTGTVWQLKFASEHDAVWQREEDPVYWATTDCNSVPVNNGLDETHNTIDYFETVNAESKNLYFTSSTFL